MSTEERLLSAMRNLFAGVRLVRAHKALVIFRVDGLRGAIGPMDNETAFYRLGTTVSGYVRY